MKNKKELHSAYFSYLTVELPIDCVNDCSHQGACDEDVEYWQRELELNLNREDMIKELEEYGAWDKEELDELEDDELEQKIVWLGACNIKEELYLEGEVTNE